MMMMMQTGGPYYQVELGRLDGKVATRAIVKHSLPGPSFNLNQLTKLFAANGLTQTDMIALSGMAITRISSSSLVLLYSNRVVSYPVPCHETAQLLLRLAHHSASFLL
jgi:hypothetical protein